MEKIKEFKISLMQRDNKKELKENEQEKSAFITKATAKFDLEKYFKENKKVIPEKREEYENFISTLSKLIYNELLNKCKDHVDSVGIWINIDGITYENSIDIDVIQKMEEYGEDDVNGIFELIKLTIPNETCI